VNIAARLQPLAQPGGICISVDVERQIRNALELDGSLAEPRAALAFVKAVFDWAWLGAESEFRRAIALNPNYATAHHWLVVYVL